MWLNVSGNSQYRPQVNQLKMSLADYDFHYQQPDIDTICTDRDLVTREIHHPNDFYGQASILKRFAGLPADRPLKAVLEHAPLFSRYMWDHDRDADLAINLSVSQERGEMISEISGKRSIPIGFGYYYAMEVFKELHPTACSTQRKGSVVFPFKSTHVIKTNFDHADYAKRLMELPDEFHPIVCCIFWKDYLHGSHLPYQEAGIPVISAGHMFDHDFMLAFYDICRQFKYAISNEMGSYVFLSVASGCPFFYLDSSEITRDIPEELLKNYCRNDTNFEAVNDFSKQLFAEPTDVILPEQQDFVDDILGKEFVQTKDEFRRVVQLAERYDRFMPLWKKTTLRRILPFPAYATRKSKKLMAKFSRFFTGRLASLNRKRKSVAKWFGRNKAA